MKKQDIVVVGAGLVGSLLALLLARRGHRVRVFERRPDMRKVKISAGKSINLALSDRGFRALEAVDAAEEVRSYTLPMAGRMMHDEKGQLSFLPYGKSGQAIHSVSRAALNITLMNRAEAHEDVRLAFEKRCVEVDFEGPGIVVEDARTGEREHVRADVVFGTDGAFSAVRLAMQMRPRFDYQQQYEAHGYKELVIPPTGKSGDERFALDKGALHIWPRGGYMLIALPNPDGNFTTTLFLPYEGERSFASLKTPADVERFFAEVFPDAKALMPTLTDDFFTNPTGDLVTVRCGPWHVGGKVCLLGDAAHAIVPFYGQGMNAGFEDVRVLGDLLDEEPEDSADWERLFARFFALRKANADAIADLARDNFVEMRDRVADPRFLLRKKIEARIHERYGESYLPLYSMVTFSHLPYAEAQRRGREHDALMERVMALPDIESKWDSAEVDGMIEAALGSRPG